MTVIPWLFLLSCIYLGLPYLFFFYGWLRWWAAVPASGLLLYAIFGFIRQVWLSAPATFPHSELSSLFKKKSTWVYVFLWIAVCLAVMSLSGAGGVGPQTSDYLKHNAVLKHLVESPWPVWLQTEQGPFPLVYYTAWYLPAAVVGKWAGWYWANATLFLWTFFGLLLSTAWFTLLVGKCRLIILAVFFLFSAPDILGAAIIKLATGELPLPGSTQTAQTDPFAYRWWYWNLRWWNGSHSWSFGFPMEYLFWAPSQSIVTWICSGMIIAGYSWASLQWRQWCVVPLMLSSLWSPMITLGLLPFFLADLLKIFLENISSTENLPNGGNKNFLTIPSSETLPSLLISSRFSFPTSWMSAPNLASLGILALLGLYYGSRFGSLPFSDHPWAKLRFFGFADWSIAEYLSRLLLVWLVDIFLPTGLVIWLYSPKKTHEWILIGTSVSVLFLMSMLRYGFNNDLSARVVMPWLFVLSIFLAKAGLKQLPIIRRMIFLGALVISATSPILEVYPKLEEIYKHRQWISLPSIENVQSLWELNVQKYRKKWETDWFIRQYIGCPKGFFFRYLAAPLPQSSDSSNP